MDFTKIKFFVYFKEHNFQSKKTGRKDLKIMPTSIELNLEYVMYSCSSKTGRKMTLFKNEQSPDRHFSEEDIQMANSHMKIFLTLLTIKEIKIKTTRCLFTLIR